MLFVENNILRNGAANIFREGTMKLFSGFAVLGYVVLLRCLPVMITFIISCGTFYGAWRHKSKMRIGFFLFMVSGSLHFILYFFLHGLLVHELNFIVTAKKIIRFQFCYQDLDYLAVTLLISTVFAIVLGTVLKRLPILFMKHGCGVECPAFLKKTLFYLCFAIIGISSLGFYSISASGIGHIVLNEAGSNNLSEIQADSGASCDYIELYNTGLLDCDISQLYLSDNADNFKKLEISSCKIPAKGYLLVYLNNGDGFSLNALGGETVTLSDSCGDILDQIVMEQVPEDAAYARQTDGGPTWILCARTPGVSNDGAAEYLFAPTFSHKSGFYSGEFDLVISAEEGTTIYYTLDGSIPTEESLRYSGPLSIGDASKNANVWSLNEGISDAYKMPDTQEDAPDDYKMPDALIDKCNVVRALCTRDGIAISPVTTATYFVGFSAKAGYDDMNFLSIVVDPDCLFDADIGIYVNENYSLRGMEQERPALLQFFSADGNLALSQKAGIRIHGGASRSNLPKSLGLYARKRYDGSDFFPADFWGHGYQPQRMILFAGGNDRFTKIKDFVVAAAVSGRDFAAMDFVPFVMFLDGEYWGNYWLTEQYDEEYISYHYGVDKNNIVMVKNDVLELGEESDYHLYQELLDYMENTDFSITENYRKACEIIDMDSFIDYYAAEIYLVNRDWRLNKNYALWRTRDIRGDKYSDGKWRWMLFDINFETAMWPRSASDDPFEYAMSVFPMFSSLMANSEFRREFAETILDMANHDFFPERINAFINYYIGKMAEPMSLEFERFYGSDNILLTYFYNTAVDMQMFFAGRYDYLTAYFENGTISVNETEGSFP